MPAPVKVNFKAGGIAEIKRAFQTIEQSAAKAAGAKVRSARAQEVAAARASKQATDLAEKERKALTAQYYKLQAEHRKLVADRVAMERKGLNATEAMLTKETSARAKAASAAADLAKRKADAIARSLERETAAHERAKERQEKREKKTMDRITSAQTRRKERIEAAATRKAAADHERNAMSMGRSVVGAAGGALRTAAGIGGAVMGLAGGFTVADAVQENMAAEQAAIALSNSSYIPGERARIDPKVFLQKAGEVSRVTGVDRASVIGGIQAYQAASGDLEGGMQNALEMTMLARGNGMQVTDLMSAMGQMRMQNKDLDPKTAMRMMRNLVVQGRKGAVEMQDFGKAAGEVTATAGAYSGDQADNQRRLLGLVQIAKPTAGSTAEAITAITRLSSDVFEHKDKFAGMGVFDKNGNINMDKLFESVLTHTKGNQGAIMDMGFGERSMKVFRDLSPIFQKAEAQKKGSGLAAVQAEINKFADATYSAADAAKDFEQVMSSKSARLEQSMLDLREAVGEAVVPELEKLIPEIAKLTPGVAQASRHFAELVAWFGQHPFQGLGAIVAGKVAAELTGSYLQDRVGKAFGSLLSAATANTFRANMIGAAGAAAVLITGFIAGKEAIDAAIKDLERRQNKAATEGATATSDALGAAHVTSDADELERMKRVRKSVESGLSREADEAYGKNDAWYDTLGKTIGSFFSPDIEAAKQRQLKSMAETERALDKLNRAIALSAGEVAKGKTNPSDPARSEPQASPKRR